MERQRPKTNAKYHERRTVGRLGERALMGWHSPLMPVQESQRDYLTTGVKWAVQQTHTCTLLSPVHVQLYARKLYAFKCIHKNMQRCTHAQLTEKTCQFLEADIIIPTKTSKLRWKHKKKTEILMVWEHSSLLKICLEGEFFEAMSYIHSNCRTVISPGISCPRGSPAWWSPLHSCYKACCQTLPGASWWGTHDALRPLHSSGWSLETQPKKTSNQSVSRPNTIHLGHAYVSVLSKESSYLFFVSA